MVKPQATRMGTEGPGVEHEAVADAQGGHRQQLALLDEVRGEEDAQRQLGQLDRLAVDGPDADPQPRPRCWFWPRWGMSGDSMRTTAASSSR